MVLEAKPYRVLNIIDEDTGDHFDAGCAVDMILHRYPRIRTSKDYERCAESHDIAVTHAESPKDWLNHEMADAYYAMLDADKCRNTSRHWISAVRLIVAYDMYDN